MVWPSSNINKKVQKSHKKREEKKRPTIFLSYLSIQISLFDVDLFPWTRLIDKQQNN